MQSFDGREKWQRHCFLQSKSKLSRFDLEFLEQAAECSTTEAIVRTASSSAAIDFSRLFDSHDSVLLEVTLSKGLFFLKENVDDRLCNEFPSHAAG